MARSVALALALVFLSACYRSHEIERTPEPWCDEVLSEPFVGEGRAVGFLRERPGVLVEALADGTFRELWTMPSRYSIASLEPILAGDGAPNTTSSLSRDGNAIVVSAGRSGDVASFESLLVDLRDGTTTRIGAVVEAAGIRPGVSRSMAWSPDGRSVLVNTSYTASSTSSSVTSFAAAQVHRDGRTRRIGDSCTQLVPFTQACRAFDPGGLCDEGAFVPRVFGLSDDTSAMPLDEDIGASGITAASEYIVGLSDVGGPNERIRELWAVDVNGGARRTLAQYDGDFESWWLAGAVRDGVFAVGLNERDGARRVVLFDDFVASGAVVDISDDDNCFLVSFDAAAQRLALYCVRENGPNSVSVYEADGRRVASFEDESAECSLNGVVTMTWADSGRELRVEKSGGDRVVLDLASGRCEPSRWNGRFTSWALR